MENLIFTAVNVKSRKPSSAGWFNFVTDAKPSACGRAFFNGKEFELSNKCHNWTSLLANGNEIFWLELATPPDRDTK